jgi:hypothetical protein
MDSNASRSIQSFVVEEDFPMTSVGSDDLDAFIDGIDVEQLTALPVECHTLDIFEPL